MIALHRRLEKLEHLVVADAVPDLRLAWYAWPDNEGAIVLAMVDFCAAFGPAFPHHGGPARTPGFDELPAESQALLVAIYALYGANWRFLDIIASMVHTRSQYVVPVCLIEGRIARTRMRRRFPGLLRLFAERGSPRKHYDDYGTPSHAPRWPESAAWTEAERDYLQHRYFQWQRVVNRHPFCLSGPNRNPFSPAPSWNASRRRSGAAP